MKNKKKSFFIVAMIFLLFWFVTIPIKSKKTRNEYKDLEYSIVVNGTKPLGRGNYCLFDLNNDSICPIYRSSFQNVKQGDSVYKKKGETRVYIKRGDKTFTLDELNGISR